MGMLHYGRFWLSFSYSFTAQWLLHQSNQSEGNLLCMYKTSPKFGRSPWCNGYRRRKWTRPHEFKSWTTLIAFSQSTHNLGQGMNPIILSPVGQTGFFSLGEATSLREGKVWIQTCKTPLKNWPCVISCPSGGVGKYDKTSPKKLLCQQ